MPAASHSDQQWSQGRDRLKQNLEDVPEADGVPTAQADSAIGHGGGQ